MSNIPATLKYTESHEWVQDNGDGTVTIGITDHAQEALGDVVFVELPEVGRELALEEEFGVIESVKAASDLYAPLAGEVIAVNESLEDAPESVNESPYDDAWILKMKVADSAELDKLLDADAYSQLVESEA
ncbi:MAG: glycine cleavage system protein H [Cobetia sp.]|jgi:glycine cleavage system H protein|uniref:Glycine cleavage system H protein n=1 Tax=Cobetia amphilecti TaxID=1055104 RepID=A0AAP4TVF1_9GAMM|nr:MULTISPECIES: glycine cleavage system protein GcvH [Cobetia]AVV33148.1 glycine cleavage system protein GcvH [Halomonas sp. SF2003]MBR9753271.1 glycine cleavage system protein GcvH [Gammaproteobacteria bacterium]TCJ25547.1 glycine cleavage system protein GcvH [Halomonas sp. GDM18]KGA01705.1 glycine cleavage system protein H [Cobetia amphilecti]KPM76783.1 glycine cleavage system protein H [Cobetia sp. UCD-24C]|tara:strand:+ start:2305 stop:2697 length:393 start_codon:yes stop_codon:yes gene_type:complete